MASDDDEDYMSDKILQQIEDVRPGIPMKKQQQREIQVAKRKAEQNSSNRWKKRNVIEEEQRQEGLKKPIDEANKGFAMLSKMGFKPGMSLGSQSESSQTAALAEPIELKLKTDGRGGLGMASKKEEASKQRVRQHLEEAAKKDSSDMAVEFRRDKQSQYDERSLQADLHKSRRVCRQLDLESGILKPTKKYYWPTEKTQEEELEEVVDDRTADDDHDDEEQIDDSEILRRLTNHLRSEYLYCIWCGCKFDNDEDLRSSCPGDNRYAHDE